MTRREGQISMPLIQLRRAGVATPDCPRTRVLQSSGRPWSRLMLLHRRYDE